MSVFHWNGARSLFSSEALLDQFTVCRKEFTVFNLLYCILGTHSYSCISAPCETYVNSSLPHFLSIIKKTVQNINTCWGQVLSRTRTDRLPYWPGIPPAPGWSPSPATRNTCQHVFGQRPGHSRFVSSYCAFTQRASSQNCIRAI